MFASDSVSLVILLIVQRTICLLRQFLIRTLFAYSNDIFSYTIDYKDGYSLETGSPVKVDKPNCIYMLKISLELLFSVR